MTRTFTARETLDRHFLEVRARILDIAAALDRVDRAPDAASIRDDPRLQRLTDALGALTDGSTDRVQRVQLLFSLPYDPDWKNRLG